MAQSGSLPSLASASQPVFGHGHPQADVVLIGEAPGQAEDLAGLPFVGASGRWLNQALTTIGWSREQLYITNLVKYRPPANRDPLPDEIEANFNWLCQEIALIQPQLIVTLGRISAIALLFERSVAASQLQAWQISREHGRLWRHTVIDRLMPKLTPTLTLYHPAAAIYNRQLEPVLAADFQQIPQYLQLINSFAESDWLAWPLHTDQDPPSALQYLTFKRKESTHVE
ncbi:MAG: DNA polymerase bacteriophage-type [Candidatus Berkelbacteria bacterium Gr01-1014_85]|uniref:Type-4 uracil-DNA glycosylase n=1 Tax=Candidatus Berkelbacteria bacterium Gr01-1014_85 TaxID=2017150 RepID=A0A554JDK3_9BACT|nr:MAG: DNA polymerase bacteriophage-type [Candidatus Berkelbacteria bacterium Gr01-1014_85]